jgi:hypothetical protein
MRILLMIKNIEDNCRIYGLISVLNAKKLLMLDYGLSNVIFETPNHAFAHKGYVTLCKAR